MENNNTRDGLSIVPYSFFRSEGEFLDSSYMVIIGYLAQIQVIRVETMPNATAMRCLSIMLLLPGSR